MLHWQYQTATAHLTRPLKEFFQMPSRATISYRDYDGERSSVSFEAAVLSAANFDSQNTLVTALQTAITDVTLGLIQSKNYGVVIDYANAPANDSAAARESKWLVVYTDDTAPARKLQMEIPCADVNTDALRQPNSDLADLEHEDWEAFVTAFEAVVLAPYTGGSVTVQEIRLVGRNL
jgi:hypothetical protein